jgi:hypothetical protein
MVRFLVTLLLVAALLAGAFAFVRDDRAIRVPLSGIGSAAGSTGIAGTLKSMASGLFRH